MRARGIVANGIITIVFIACTGGGDGSSTSSSSGGSSSGASSSGGSSAASSSGASSTSSSGSVQYSTTCDPVPDGHLTDATIDNTATLLEAPCPIGYKPKPPPVGDTGGTFPAPQRYSTEAAFVAEHCDVDPSDAGTGAEPIDYSTSDVVAVMVPGGGFTTAPLLVKGGELWVKRTHTTCTGAAQAWANGYYVVPKAKELKVQSCTTTCTCTPPPCQFALTVPSPRAGEFRSLPRWPRPSRS